MPNRDDAYNLLTKYTSKESLLKHAFAVEQVMLKYAEKFGEDTEKWRIAGLLHDFDYEIHPTMDKHPIEGAKILKENNYSDDIIEAILGHGNHTGVERVTKMAKTLYAVDELTGFLIACALVRPDKNIMNLKLKSIKKKMKDKAFARAVNRDDIKQGIEELEIDFDEHITFVINALHEISSELGLEN